jgi:pyruvate/2-oxoglutarate dehydrogenase complex dihydrolipoamide dehydrogenase (E3) component
LVASAQAAHLARRGAEYGVGTGAISVDMAKVKARKDAIMLGDRKGVEDWLDGMDGCTVIRGHARFTDPHTMRIGDEVLHAERIFLNVGGRAVVPDIPGLADIDFLTNVSILELNTLPEHLVIVGGSYIALEFAQMYRRFGAKVTVVADIRIAKRDNSVEGFELTPRAGAAPISGSHLLLAVGRRPNTDDLGLEHAGVRTDARGYITVDDQLKTSVDHIWAMGDCNGKGAFTHTSYNDFEIVAGNLLDADQRRVSDRITAYALYIDPPLGRAGMTVEQVRASGRPALVGQRPMTRVGRAVEKGETQGFMKVVVDAETQQILGAAILGVGGDEAIHAILDVMSAKAPYTTLSRTMNIHPTVCELIPTMLQEMSPLQ